MKVLFLCTANICRSPLAEHYMRQLAEKIAAVRIECASAGILDYSGRPADPVVVRMARERGLDLSRHASRLTHAAELAATDRIVCMERKHRAWIRENHPDHVAKAVLLRPPVDGEQDVPDPTGGPESEYRSALDLLYRGVESLALSYKYPR